MINNSSKSIWFYNCAFAIGALAFVGLWIFSFYINSTDSPLQRSLLMLNGSDEEFYLPRVRDVGKYLSPNRYYFEEDRVHDVGEILRQVPSSVLELIVGLASAYLNLSSSQIGLILDLITIPLSFYCCCLMWSSFGQSRRMSVAATLFQFLFYNRIDLLRQSEFYLFDGLFSAQPLGPGFFEIQRGVFTQICYPIFFLGLVSLTRNFLVLDRPEKIFPKLFAGIVVGAQIYLYFFSFLASSVILFLLSGRSLICRIYNRRIVGDCKHNSACAEVVSCLSYLVTCAPGLYLIYRYGGGDDLTFRVVRDYWYFSIEWAILLILSLIALRLKPKLSLGILPELAVILCISHFSVMNLQPFLGVLLTPWRITQLYILPILYTALVLIILTSLKNLRLLGRFQETVVFVIALMFTLKTAVLTNYLFLPGAALRDETELYETIEFIRDTTPEDSVLVSPQLIYFRESSSSGHFIANGIPNLILRFLSDRHILFQGLAIRPRSHASETINRARLSHALLTGADLISATKLEPVSLPGDLFGGTRTFYQLISESLKTQYRIDNDSIPGLCEISKRYKADYLITDLSIPGLEHSSDWLSNYCGISFQSSGSRYLVCRIDRNKVADFFCRQTNSSAT